VASKLGFEQSSINGEGRREEEYDLEYVLVEMYSVVVD
jgi:hypothetical protein